MLFVIHRDFVLLLNIIKGVALTTKITLILLEV